MQYTKCTLFKLASILSKLHGLWSFLESISMAHSTDARIKQASPGFDKGN